MKEYRAIPLGVACVLCTLLAWISGATSTVTADGDSGTWAGPPNGFPYGHG